MVIVSQVIYPPESSQEMATRFLEAPQVPEKFNRIGPYFSANLQDGIVGLSIWETDPQNIVEMQTFIGNYLAVFFGVPGYKYETKSFYKVEEALKLIGMG